MENEKKMKFHLTITNNETGEVLHDVDACAIIAGVNEGKENGSIAMVDCGPVDLLEALMTTEETVQDVYTEHPELRALGSLLAYAEMAAQAKDTETEEPKKEE